MDPLSITAGLIAVIQTANKALSLCLTFRTALKESPSGLTRTIDEVRNLRNIFEALQLGLDGKTDTLAGADVGVVYEKVRDSVSGILPHSQDILDELEQRLSSPLPAALAPVSAISRVSAAARWYLIEPEVKSCLDRLEKCKTRLILALSVHQSTLLLDIRATTITLHSRLEASNSRIEDKLNAMSASKSEDGDIFKWLSSITSRPSHLDTVRQHQVGTSNWVSACDEFKKWYRGDTRLLWLNGAPGTGKTQLFAYLVEYLITDTSRSSEHSLVAYTYCDFRKSESLEPSNILGSIVAQCCMETGSIPGAIRAAFKASQSAGHEAPPSLTLLKESLSEMLQTRKIFILIDGLDESKMSIELGDIIRSIYIRDSHSHARVLVTGRKTESLEQVFNDALQLQLHDHRQEIREDIQVYVRSQLQKNRHLQWLPSEIKQHISDALAADSNPMFRWAQCQLDAIAPLRSVKAIRQALTQLPSGLEATYRKILLGVPQYACQTMRSALEWISFSLMPLTLTELYEVLAVEPGTLYLDSEARLSKPMDIIFLGNSLFELSPTGHVHLSHLSVRDYLVSPKYGSDTSVDHFCFTMQDSHRNLALICLTYLMLRDFSDGPAKTAESYTQRLQQYPFLKYAASAWPYHANLAFAYYYKDSQNEDKTGYDDLLKLVLEFFDFRHRANFMAWVQILNATYNFKWDIYPRHATPLYYAASFGLDCVVEKLISSSEFNQNDLDAPGSRYGGTPVHAAVYRQHTSTVQLLLSAGANAAKADFNGVTPLHSAAAIGDLDILRILLDDPCSGEMANAKDHAGETPYDWAQRASQTLAAELLKSRSHLRPEPLQGLGAVPKALAHEQEVDIYAADSERGELEAEQSVSPRLGPISPNQPVGYFPDFYSKRSGLDSSVVLAVSTGKSEL